MRGFTVCLEEQDIERLKNEARRVNIPPATLARSLLVQALAVRHRGCSQPIDREVDTNAKMSHDLLD